MGQRGKDLTSDPQRVIISMSCDGYTQKDIARVLEISQSTVSKMLKRVAATGSIENWRV